MDDRIFAPDDAAVGVLEQRAARVLRQGVVFRRDDQIDVAGQKQGKRRRIRWKNLHLYARRNLRERADDVREQDLDQIVRRHDPKSPFSGRGFETRPSVQRDANALQDLANLGREIQSQRRRLHAPADRRQQLIAEVLPQSAQGAAHGRLTQSAGDLRRARRCAPRSAHRARRADSDPASGNA